MIFEGMDEYRAAGFTPRIGIIGAGPAGISIARKLGKGQHPDRHLRGRRQRLHR